MIPVVELLRVSTESQAAEDRAGLPAQHAANLQTCTRLGLQIVESVEIVESGTEVARSPQMAAVLDTVISGRARGILLAEYSRLFRPDRWSDMIVLQTLSDHNAPIYLPSGPIDLQSELGFVQATINNLVAAMERRRIQERMHRGKEEHRRRGAHVSGVGIPFGMRYSKTGGWEWTDEAAIVRELFRRFLAGERNYDALGKALGLPRTTTRFLLTNPVYTGWRVYSERHDLSPQGRYPGSRHRRKIPRRPEDVIRVRLPLEPLVSEDDFATVQALVQQKAARRPRNSRTDIFLYRGLLACECGLNVYTFANGRGHHFYYCRSWNPQRRADHEKCNNGFMEVKRLERLLDAAIAERLTDADVLVRAVRSYLKSLDHSWRRSQPDVAALSARLEQLQQKRVRILESYYDGHIGKPDRDARLTVLDSEIATADRVLNAPAAISATALPEAAVVAIVETFAEWPFIQRASQREVLEKLSPKFYVRKYGIEGVRFPFAALAGGCNMDGHSPKADHVTTSTQYNQTPGGLYVPLSA